MRISILSLLIWGAAVALMMFTLQAAKEQIGGNPIAVGFEAVTGIDVEDPLGKWKDAGQATRDQMDARYDEITKAAMEMDGFELEGYEK